VSEKIQTINIINKGLFPDRKLSGFCDTDIGEFSYAGSGKSGIYIINSIPDPDLKGDGGE